MLLTNALAAEWTPAQAAVLRRVSGVESVHDAVTRTSSAKACAPRPAFCIPVLGFYIARRQLLRIRASLWCAPVTSPARLTSL